MSDLSEEIKNDDYLLYEELAEGTINLYSIKDGFEEFGKLVKSNITQHNGILNETLIKAIELTLEPLRKDDDKKTTLSNAFVSAFAFIHIGLRDSGISTEEFWEFFENFIIEKFSDHIQEKSKKGS